MKKIQLTAEEMVIIDRLKQMKMSGIPKINNVTSITIMVIYPNKSIL